MKIFRVLSKPYNIAFMAGVALAVAYSLNNDSVLRVPLGLVFICTSTYAALKARESAAYLIVFALHIGPCVRFQIPGFFGITMGDILFIIFAGILLSDGIQRTPYSAIWGAIPVLFLVGVPFYPSLQVALPGFISLMQLVFVYLITVRYTQTASQAENLIRYISLGVVISALMHIYAYYNGASMILLEKGGTTSLEDLYGDYVLDNFGKTAFFYTTFIASCSMVLSIALRRLTSGDYKYRLDMAFWLVVFVIVGVSSLFQGSRTIFVSCILALGVHYLTQLSLGDYSRTAYAVVWGSAVLALGYISAPMVLGDAWLPYAEMFSLTGSFAIGSATERVVMFEDAIAKVAEFPQYILFGIGPEVPRRAPEEPEVIALMSILELGQRVMSFHNFYLDVLYQHGILFFSGMLWLLWVSLRACKVTCYNSRVAELRSDCFVSIIACMILWNSHATGWTKPLAILFQLLAIVHASSHRSWGIIRST